MDHSYYQNRKLHFHMPKHTAEKVVYLSTSLLKIWWNIYTPQKKLNIEPENDGFQKEYIPFSRVFPHFRVKQPLVFSGGVTSSPCPQLIKYIQSGQIIIFHQPRFPWIKGISFTFHHHFKWKLVWGCELIWPDQNTFNPFPPQAKPEALPVLPADLIFFRKVGGWTSQPVGKNMLLVKLGIISPRIGVNIKKYLSCHHLVFLLLLLLLLSLAALPKNTHRPWKMVVGGLLFLLGNPIFAMLVFREGNPRKQTGQFVYKYRRFPKQGA